MISRSGAPLRAAMVWCTIACSESCAVFGCPSVVIASESPTSNASGFACAASLAEGASCAVSIATGRDRRSAESARIELFVRREEHVRRVEWSFALDEATTE